jgi:general secretion pathway protein G
VSCRTDRAARGIVRRGFSLIELLVVIVIIATLASVVGPSIFGNVGEARISAAKSQLQIFGLALDSYRLDNDVYPSTSQGLDALRSLPLSSESAKNWKGPYLRQAVPADPWGRAYHYLSPGTANPDAYDLYSLGRDGRLGGTGEDADVTSWKGEVRQ